MWVGGASKNVALNSLVLHEYSPSYYVYTNHCFVNSFYCDLIEVVGWTKTLRLLNYHPMDARKD